MSIQLTINALEYYYEYEIFPGFDRCKHGIEDSFEYLSESIQLQQEIIKLKKQEDLDANENERTLENLKRYWLEDTSNPQAILDKYKKELENELYWCPKNIESAKERGWDNDVILYQERLEHAEKQIKLLETYTIDDVEKITGKRPF